MKQLYKFGFAEENIDLNTQFIMNGLKGEKMT